MINQMMVDTSASDTIIRAVLLKHWVPHQHQAYMAGSDSDTHSHIVHINHLYNNHGYATRSKMERELPRMLRLKDSAMPSSAGLSSAFILGNTDLLPGRRGEGVYMARVTTRGVVYIPIINSAIDMASLLHNVRPSCCKN